MKGRTSWRMVGVATGLMLLVSVGEAVEPATGEQLLADVRARVQTYESAWNTHDASRVAAFFSRDADMVMGNGPRVSGREAIAEWWARYFAAISDRRVGRISVESIRMLTPEVALVNVNTLTAGRDEEDQELPARRARGTWILTSRDGEWLISALRGLPAEGEMRVEPGRDR